MAESSQKPNLQDPVTRHLHKDFTCLRPAQTVREALDWLRAHPPGERIIYFYVVDNGERLVGVVPTRRLILSSPETPIAEIMVRHVVALPAEATVFDACEFFIQHRMLAFPVVDAERRMVGIVDVDLYTQELIDLGSTGPVRRWLRPYAQFLQVESASGILLLICTIIALLAANSPWSASVANFWHAPVGFTIGSYTLSLSLVHWINDGLMVLFFFVIGLEIKRELLFGELNTPARALLPIVAALGGMVVPALVYLGVTAGAPNSIGWGIPMATDIAFVVGFLTLLGNRVPHSLKILLLTLAIVDDIGATLVIALVYAGKLSLPSLAWAGAGFLLVLIFRWIGVRPIRVYVLLGILIWLAVLESGIHPTIAGVALGLLTPARPRIGDRVAIDAVGELFRRFTGLAESEPATANGGLPAPLDRIENALHPWVAFGIMPLFGLANAGVSLEIGAFAKPVAIAVALGLFVGKPLGITLFIWSAIKVGWTRLPAELNLKVLFAAGFLGGIGFTMSLFIARLALRGAELEEAKLGILCGSTLSAAVGCVLLSRFLPPKPDSPSA